MGGSNNLWRWRRCRTTEGDRGREETTESTEGIREGTTKDAKNTKKEMNAREGLGIGLVGPMSNYAAPPQLVEEVPYRDLEEMHAFARRWRDEHRGQWFTAGKLSGFCLLMKRAVYEAIGGLDERFGLGFFDDDDLAVRARRAGFELAVAHDLFVHHFGSRTFAGQRDRCREAAGGERAPVRGEMGSRGGPWAAGHAAALDGREGTCPQMTQMDADETRIYTDAEDRETNGAGYAGVECRDSDI